MKSDSPRRDKGGRAIDMEEEVSQEPVEVERELHFHGPTDSWWISYIFSAGIKYQDQKHLKEESSLRLMTPEG